MSNLISASRLSHVSMTLVKYVKESPRYYNYWWNHVPKKEKILEIIFLGYLFWGLGFIAGSIILRREFFAQSVKGMKLMTIPTAIFLIVIVRELGKNAEISCLSEQRPFTKKKTQWIRETGMSQEEHRARNRFYYSLLEPLQQGRYYRGDQQPHPDLANILKEFEERGNSLTANYNTLCQELKAKVKWPQEAKPNDEDEI